MATQSRYRMAPMFRAPPRSIPSPRGLTIGPAGIVAALESSERVEDCKRLDVPALRARGWTDHYAGDDRRWVS